MEIWTKLWHIQMAGVNPGGISRSNIGISWGHGWMASLAKHTKTFSGPRDSDFPADPDFRPGTVIQLGLDLVTVLRSRATLKFWSATMFGAAARNFGPVHKFELPTVIADSVPRATRVFSLASVGHVTGHMVSHMVPMARCRPPHWKIFTVNNLATVF